jgi:serine/threonine protein kinase
VFKGFDSRQRQVAIKCYKLDGFEQGIEVGILREIVYLKSLPLHANIIRFDEVEWIGSRIRVSMPLYQTDLNNYIR